jgi:hypothetical protein
MDFGPRGDLLLWWLRVGVVIAVAPFAAPASAQQAPEFMGEEHIRLHARLLDVEDNDDSAAHAVFSWYRHETGSFREARRSIQEFTVAGPAEETSGPRPPAPDEDEALLTFLKNRVFDSIRSVENELVLDTNARYFGDLREAIPDQIDVVDRLERSWRRERQFAALNTYFGANVDLIRLADESVETPAARALLEDVLGQWESAVNGLLMRFEHSQASWRERQAEAFAKVREGVMSVDDAADVYFEGMLHQSRILRLTESFVPQVVDALDEKTGSEFQRAWRERKYPFVWKRTDETGPLNAALARDDVVGHDRATLEALRDEIERIRTEVTTRLDALQRAAVSESYLTRYAREWVAWRVDPTLSRPNRDADDAFTAAAQSFLADMEAIGDRVREVLAASRTGSGGPTP